MKDCQLIEVIQATIRANVDNAVETDRAEPSGIDLSYKSRPIGQS